jgi:hypothetical protein
MNSSYTTPAGVTMEKLPEPRCSAGISACGFTKHPASWFRACIVAQSCTLLFRGFVIRSRWQTPVDRGFHERVSFALARHADYGSANQARAHIRRIAAVMVIRGRGQRAGEAKRKCRDN